MRKLRLSTIWLNTALTVVALAFIAPLAYILVNSFKTTPEIFQIPQSFLPKIWTLSNYMTAFASQGLLGYFVNSAVITIVGVILVVVLSSLAGYGFARLPFRGRSVLFWVTISTVTIPLVIFLVPMFLMENSVGLLSTWWGLILPDTAITLPFAILIMRSAYLGIPREIEESATIDGCGVFRQWWSIMMPLARNGLVLIVIITTYTIWGEYTLAKTLATNPGAMPLSVGFTLLKGEVWQFGLLAAVIVLALIPPITIFLIFQKHIVSGITQGSLKG